MAIHGLLNPQKRRKLMRKDLYGLNMPLLTSIQLLLFYLFFQIVPDDQKPFMVAFLIALIFVSYFWTLLKSFTLLISGALLSSFYYFWLAWNQARADQLQLIIQQLVFILFATATWGLAVYVKRYMDENKSLKKRVHELEKYNPELGVLTTNEFLDKAQILFTAVKRRKENTVAIKITFQEFPQDASTRKTSKGLMRIISQAVISSVRKEFDIVGYLSQNKLLVLLQNTNEAGANIVIARIREKLASFPNLNSQKLLEDINFEVRSFGDDFESFKEYIGSEFALGGN